MPNFKLITMAQNIKNILALPLPDSIKEGLITKTLADNLQVSMEECQDMVELGISLVRTGERSTIVSIGWKILKYLEDTQLAYLERVIDASMVELVLNTEAPFNPREVPALVGWCLRYGPKKALVPAIQQCLGEFLRSTSCDTSILVATVELLNETPACMPSGGELVKFCEVLVLHLASLSMPRQAALMSPFISDVCQVEHFLGKILQESSDREEALFACLRVVYTAISSQPNCKGPSPALACILQLVEPQMIPGAVQRILGEDAAHVGLGRALAVLCDWLIVWPRATRVSRWVLELIDGLEAEGRCDVLVNVARNSLERLFAALQLPAIRPGVEPVVWRMLAANQFSSEAFHKVVSKIPQVMRQLKREDTPTSYKVLQALLDNSCTLMALFPGYPDLYEPVLKAQEECCQGMVAKVLRTNSSIQWLPAEKASSLDDVPIQRHSTTGRIGLNNLGNTCYMNSVLQALFMTRRFCCAVLESSGLETQPVLCKLQSLFALLIHSQRPALSPFDMLTVSRPPGFVPGHQQDSSEFLIHLLDVLHEQEKKWVTSQQQAVSPVLVSEQGAGGGDDITEEDTAQGAISRWTTEEDLSAGSILQRKARSLADFIQAGDETPQSQNLSCTLSVSADSGIHSVGGDESGAGSCLPDHQELPVASYESIVQQTFGGKMLISYQCLSCGCESVHTDPFTDIQLSFPDQDYHKEDQELELQDLVNYFVSPEKLCGENSYNCDKCGGLRVGQRSLQVLQAPSHLVLTLKHFRYNHVTKQRTKLLHKVRYPELVELPVVATGQQQQSYRETYRLYGAVVHSGKSVDSGHYYTYARDESDSWFLFNDSTVSSSSVEELARWHPPDTPYILFYSRPQELLHPPPRSLLLSDLQPHLIELVNSDNARYAQEQREERRRRLLRMAKSPSRNRRPEDPDDNPPSSCGGGVNLGNLPNRFVF